ncbi:MAG: pre-rRNA-processing TSR2 family protein [Actinomycetota bacterium]|nr:pre-rRNA-processing TSR2 family protein [Actinomycetota bacterium]
MHPADPPNDTPTEGQIVPPEEQIIPSGGGPILGQEATEAVQEESGGEESQDKAEELKGQAQSLAREKPMPIALAAAFVAGVVVGRIASRR